MSPTKFNIRDQKVLYIIFDGKSYQRHYLRAQSITNLIEYICKDGNYITNIAQIFQGKFLTEKEQLVQKAKKEGIPQALVDYAKNNPNKAFPGNSIVTNYTSFKKSNS